MEAETKKNCQSCKASFIIKPDDFAFYEKINVPPPTLCPDCRQQRRYAWRNERVLYRRKCDLCGKSTVTIYSPNKPFKVYCPPCWWSDKWDAFEYGRDFDFSRPFFEQWQELQLQVPRIALLTKNSVNSEYTNHSSDNKNCYLCFGVFDSEDLLYSTNMWGGKKKDCSDCYRVLGSADLLYECVDCEGGYQCQYGMLLRDCADCFYCYDCRGCSNCFLSSNLRNKQYYIFNKPHTKEEYFKKIKEYGLVSFSNREKLYDLWLERMKNDSIHRFAIIDKSTNVSGNVILNAKNAHHVFDGNDIEDVKYATLCVETKDSMDFYHIGLACELIYEGHGLTHDYNVLFAHLSYDNSHLVYCDTCQNSENLFGCVGVKKGSYCILNKRYEENEYKALKEKIVEYMKETSEYGEFFPPEISPIGYNETQGQIYMPLSKEEIMKRGWKWEDEVPGTFGKETIKKEDIPDSIENARDSIINEVLPCAKCGKNYKIIKLELDLYRKLNVPIPRLCSDCRYMRRITLRPPRKLWHRQCVCLARRSFEKAKEGDYHNSIDHNHHPEGRCPNEFETSYAPERKEIVYCEKCYNAEVV